MNNIENVIVICDFGFTKGGSEKVAIESSVGLANKGKKITFFCASAPIDDRLNHKNINVVCLQQKAIVENSNKLAGMIQGIWNSKANKELKKILKRHDKNNTIVHFHLWQKSLSGSVIKSVKDEGFKSVFTMHHYFMACPNGGFFNYRKNEICSCKAMSFECITKNCDSRNYLYKIWRCARLFTEQNISCSFDTIKDYIYISELGKNALIPYLDNSSNYYYIPNPIHIKKEKLKNKKDNNYYVYIGRLSKEKGVHLLANVAKELKLKIIFVGEGECRQDILDIYPEAIITGWLDKDSVSDYIKKARAMIFPSLWYEGMPLSVLECLANGVPVIVTDTCAAREVIFNDKNGYLFKNGNKDDLKEKINRLNDNNKLEKLSQGAYESFWENDYSLEAHLNKLIDTYNNILSK